MPHSFLKRGDQKMMRFDMSTSQTSAFSNFPELVLVKYTALFLLLQASVFLDLPHAGYSHKATFAPVGFFCVVVVGFFGWLGFSLLFGFGVFLFVGLFFLLFLLCVLVLK